MLDREGLSESDLYLKFRTKSETILWTYQKAKPIGQMKRAG